MWISVSGQSLTNDEEVVIGGMVVFRDITALRLSSENLESVSQQMCSLVENQQSGILIESDERRILQTNQVFCSLDCRDSIVSLSG